MGFLVGELKVKRLVLTNKCPRMLCAGEGAVGSLGSARKPRLEVGKSRMRGLAVESFGFRYTLLRVRFSPKERKDTKKSHSRSRVDGLAS